MMKKKEKRRRQRTMHLPLLLHLLVVLQPPPPPQPSASARPSPTRYPASSNGRCSPKRAGCGPSCPPPSRRRRRSGPICGRSGPRRARPPRPRKRPIGPSWPRCSHSSMPLWPMPPPPCSSHPSATAAIPSSPASRGRLRRCGPTSGRRSGSWPKRTTSTSGPSGWPRGGTRSCATSPGWCRSSSGSGGRTAAARGRRSRRRSRRGWGSCSVDWVAWIATRTVAVIPTTTEVAVVTVVVRHPRPQRVRGETATNRALGTSQ
mmetsp:Transcript_11833/g.33808  ORF Transcript_11833/g.33808 Transcript_11833/m.33808 type:complete len:261 (-) Transcript_11833:4388-5170(-)